MSKDRHENGSESRSAGWEMTAEKGVQPSEASALPGQEEEPEQPEQPERPSPPGRAAQPGPIGRHGDFNKLWFGQAVSSVGSQVTLLALPLTAVLYLHATAGQVGLMTAAGLLAYCGPSLLFGVMADRMRRRPLMIAADIGRTSVVGLVPVLAWTGSLRLPVLYGVALVQGGLTVIFEVAYRSYLPSLVSAEALLAGNSRLQSTASVAQIGGPGLSGGLVDVLGAPFALLVDAGSFVVSVASLLWIRAREPGPGAPRPGCGFRRPGRGQRGPGRAAVHLPPSRAALAGRIRGGVQLLLPAPADLVRHLRGPQDAHVSRRHRARAGLLRRRRPGGRGYPAPGPRLARLREDAAGRVCDGGAGHSRHPAGTRASRAEHSAVHWRVFRGWVRHCRDERRDHDLAPDHHPGVAPWPGERELPVCDRRADAILRRAGRLARRARGTAAHPVHLCGRHAHFGPVDRVVPHAQGGGRRGACRARIRTRTRTGTSGLRLRDHRGAAGAGAAVSQARLRPVPRRPAPAAQTGSSRPARPSLPAAHPGQRRQGRRGRTSRRSPRGR